MTNEQEIINVLLVDDHSIITSGLSQILTDHPKIRVVGFAQDGSEVQNRLIEIDERVDIILMDINMPKMNGIEATKIISKKFPSIRTIMLTVHSDQKYVIDSFMNGAKAYVQKDGPIDELLHVIEHVHNYGCLITPAQLKIFINSMQSMTVKKYRETEAELNNRELEIIKLIASEFTTKEIADKLNVSVRTVDTHRANIMKKIGAKNNSGLVMYAIQKGLLSMLS